MQWMDGQEVVLPPGSNNLHRNTRMWCVKIKYHYKIYINGISKSFRYIKSKSWC